MIATLVPMLCNHRGNRCLSLHVSRFSEGVENATFELWVSLSACFRMILARGIGARVGGWIIRYFSFNYESHLNLVNIHALRDHEFYLSSDRSDWRPKKIHYLNEGIKRKSSVTVHSVREHRKRLAALVTFQGSLFSRRSRNPNKFRPPRGNIWISILLIAANVRLTLSSEV